MNNPLLDHTGYGPTSSGRAASPTELRQNVANQYHTGRAIQAMQYQDPGTRKAAESMVKLGMGKNRSPEAVRRAIYTTQPGQAVQDAAFAMRSAGVIGDGDPRKFAQNNVNTMAGGFKHDFLAGELNESNGRMLGYNQRVSGNGITTERAAIHMQKKMLDNLYGEDQDTDPSKLNGYNMEEASRVAQRVVGRGGMGKYAKTIVDADVNTRLDAAINSEVNPEVKAGLSALTDKQREKLANAEVSGDSTEMDAAIADISKELNNPQAADALKQIGKARNATVFNDAAVKNVADTVKEVTKGMAALNDIYGDLSSDEAHAMLEQINGGRITNKQQARGAARVVDNMRNAAEGAGMDPKEAMQMLGAQQEGLKAMLDNAFKTDSRGTQASTKAAADIANAIMPQAIEASGRDAQANKALTDLGIEGFDKDGKSAESIAADNAMMVQETAVMFKGQAVANSDMIGLSKGAKEQMTELANEAAGLDTSTDQGLERQNQIESQLQGIIEQDTGKTMEQYIQSGNGRNNALQGTASEATRKFANKHAREALVGSKNLTNALEGSELSEDEKVKLNRSVLNDLGGKDGLSELAEINAIENDTDRAAATDDFFKRNKVTDENRKLYDKSLVRGSDDSFEKGASISTEEKAKLDKSLLKSLGGKDGMSKLAEINAIEDKDERASSLDKFFKENNIDDDTRKLYEKSQTSGASISTEEKAKLDKSLLKSLGGKDGMSKLAEINAIEDKDERASSLDKFFKENNIDDDTRKLYEKSQTSDSNFKDRFTEYTRAVDGEDHTGGYGTARADREEAKTRLSNLKKNEDRVRMTDADGKITANSIASAMFKGDVENPMARADTATATLQALQESGVSMMMDDEEAVLDENGKQKLDEKGRPKMKKVKRDVTKMYTGDMDTSKGLTSEMLTKIDEAAGGKVGLLDRVNKAMGTEMTQEEFLAKSNDAEVKDATYTALDDAGSEMGFKVSAADDKLNVMNEKAMGHGEKYTERFKKNAELQSLSPMIGKERLAQMSSDVLGGRKADIGDLLHADDYDAGGILDPFSNDRKETKDGKKGAYMQNFKQFDVTAKTLNDGGQEAVKAMAGMEGSDDALAQMDAQIKAMESAKADGREVMVDDKGNERELNDQTINEYKTAAENLRKAIDEMAGSQKVGVMTVTKLEVTGDFTSEKK